MELRLKRRWYTDESTVGELRLGDQHLCWTLEDRRRPDGVKVPGGTCISPGRYRVALTVSPAARRGELWTPRADGVLPLLVDVPGFDGVRIHSGNTHGDTLGCILVGKFRAPDRLGGSRQALEELLPTLQVAIDRKEEIWLTMEDGEEWTSRNS